MPRRESAFEHQIDRLRTLYRTDPPRFEQLRQDLIRQTIETFPPSQRARAYGIQFELDAVLSRYHDPVARMNKMVEIFWEQVGRFLETVSDPAEALAKRERDRHDAQVIPLHPRKRLH